MPAMIASTVAHEVARALRDFLATGFGPSNPALVTVLDDFSPSRTTSSKTPTSIALGGTLAKRG